MLRTVIYVLVFWAMQVIATIFFKWGSESQSRWIWGFVVGNLFGFSSVWLMMLVYKVIHPNLALGICAGGAFLLAQIAVAVVFRLPVAPMQWVGIAAIVIGMLTLAFGTPKQSSPDTLQVSSHPSSSVALTAPAQTSRQ